MNHKPAALIFIAIGTLLVSACTHAESTAASELTVQASEASAPSEHDSRQTPAVPSATDSAPSNPSSEKELAAWAEEKKQDWMDDINEGWEDVVMDIDEPADFLKWYPSDPHGHIESFQAPRYGHLVLTLEPYAWETDAFSDLAYVGSNTMLRIGARDKNLQSVTVVTRDQEHSYEATRENWPPVEQ
ncbi:hypothetical protein [Glutamicibacter sp. NPDC087344]|uniref:hypothetical protein n=1 Tax=Glutamicibacter sp. NPDC087344 TaxID=3363994 RepID=UPI003819C9E4